MDPVIQQWRDGLITAEEALVKLINDVAEIVMYAKKEMDTKYWYRLEKLGDVKYEYVKQSKLMLITREQADTLNRSCLEGYRWHSVVAAIPEPRD